LHQFLGTKTTEADKLLKTDAKTVLYRTILRVFKRAYQIGNTKTDLGRDSPVFKIES
jgi:hypothetical protein